MRCVSPESASGLRRARTVYQRGLCPGGYTCFNYTERVLPDLRAAIARPGGLPSFEESMAICIRDSSSFQLQQTASPPAAAEVVHAADILRTLSSFGSSGVHVGAGAFLGNIDGSGPISASSLQIAARSEKELFGAVSYTTLIGGWNACLDCASVGINPVPYGTMDIAVRVSLAAVGQKAKVYLGLFDEL